VKFIIPAIFAALLATTAQATETNPLFQAPDAQSKFRDAQLHVKELMNTGRYQEAAKYMTVYQTLACEATEQKAGKSIEEGAAICARKNNPGNVNTGIPPQQSAQSATDSILGPGITVLPRHLPGSSTLLDGSTPSIFVFDPRSVPGSGSQTRSRTDSQKIDPWTGSP
jgi:hypothetical protein